MSRTPCAPTLSSRSSWAKKSPRASPSSRVTTTRSATSTSRAADFSALTFQIWQYGRVKTTIDLPDDFSAKPAQPRPGADALNEFCHEALVEKLKRDRRLAGDEGTRSWPVPPPAASTRRTPTDSRNHRGGIRADR